MSDNNNSAQSPVNNNPQNPAAITNNKPNKKRVFKTKRKLQPEPNGEIDHFTKTPEARAMLKNRSNNVFGINQYSVMNTLVPYPLRYAIADALLKENKTTRYVSAYTGLSLEIVNRIKTGEIKLINTVVDRVKNYETQNMVILGNAILDRIDENDIKNASLLQKVTAAGILIDKRRLLAGESTQNVALSAVARLDELVSRSEGTNKNLESLKKALNK